MTELVLYVAPDGAWFQASEEDTEPHFLDYVSLYDDRGRQRIGPKPGGHQGFAGFARIYSRFVVRFPDDFDWAGLKMPDLVQVLARGISHPVIDAETLKQIILQKLPLPFTFHGDE